jgi:hypothetical protein
LEMGAKRDKHAGRRRSRVKLDAMKGPSPGLRNPNTSRTCVRGVLERKEVSCTATTAAMVARSNNRMKYDFHALESCETRKFMS